MKLTAKRKKVIEQRTAHRRDLLWREDLQGIRAIALFLMIVGHAGAPFIGFIVAVDVFTIMSGFAMTLLMLRVVEKYEKIYIAPYFATRIKRLIPAVTLMLVFVVITITFILPLGTGDSKQTITVANAAMFFTANIAVDTALNGYFAEDLFTRQNPLVHMWGLSVEEQIFIVFPFILLIASFFSKKVFTVFKKNMIIVLAVFGVLSFSMIYLAIFGVPIPFMSDDPKSAIYLSAFTRFWQFAAGAILAALVYRNYKVKFPILSAIIGVSLVLFVAFTLSPFDIYPSALAILVALGTCLIIYAGSGAREASLKNPLSFKPLTFVGDISYPWFLWHMPFIVFAFVLFEKNFWIGLAAGLLAGIPAYFSDRFFEKPIFYSNTLTIKKTLIGFPILVVLFFAFTSIVSSNYIVERTQPWAWDNHKVIQNNCQLLETPVEECTWSNSSSSRSLALIGDSLAMTVADGVIAAGLEEGWSTTVIAGFNCPVASREENADQCRAFSDKALNYINANNPDAVMIVNNYPTVQSVVDTLDIIEELESKGIDVILMDGSTKGDKYSGKQTTLVRRGEPTRYKDELEVDPFIRKIVVDAADSRASVSVRDALCANERCLTALDGVELYSDERHLSPQGALFMKPYIVEALQEVESG